MLRALQFAARFELTSTKRRGRLLRGIPLDDLPAERVWGEIEKLLLQAARPSIGFALALDLGVVERLWPELRALIGCPQEPEWHPEGDVWIHTLMVIDEARKRIEGLDRGPAAAIMLGAVCHDFGKPPRRPSSTAAFDRSGHEEAGVAPATALARSAERPHARWVRCAPHGARPRRAPPEAERVQEVADAGQRRRVPAAGAESRPRDARALRQSRLPRPRPATFDCSAMDWFLERARALGVEHHPPAPLVLGRHLLELGVRPGARMGEILKAIYERQLDGEVQTLDEGLDYARLVIK